MYGRNQHNIVKHPPIKKKKNAAESSTLTSHPVFPYLQNYKANFEWVNENPHNKVKNQLLTPFSKLYRAPIKLADGKKSHSSEGNKTRQLHSYLLC